MFLYQKDPNNISVIDKLVLSIMKAFNVSEASKWVEEKKDTLIKAKSISEEVFAEISKKQGTEIALAILNSAPNMYQLCREKISQVGNIIESNGRLYSDFESALPYYKSRGIITHDDSEGKEFNDIMDFLYLGRKEKLQEISGESNPYIVMNFSS